MKHIDTRGLQCEVLTEEMSSHLTDIMRILHRNCVRVHRVPNTSQLPVLPSAVISLSNVMLPVLPMRMKVYHTEMDFPELQLVSEYMAGGDLFDRVINLQK